MTNLTLPDHMIRQYPLLYSLFSATYVLGCADGEPMDQSLFGAMFRAGSIPGPLDAAEAELAGLTGAQLVLVLRADPGERLPFAPLACEALRAMFD